MSKMTLEELEETLTEVLPTEFEIKITKKGVVIYTFLKENQYGELIPLDEDDEDEEYDDEFDGDEDLDSLDEEMSDE